MGAKVVDASTLGALVFGEPRAEEALTMLKGAELFAPALLDYELVSVARRKILRYPAQRKAITEALRLGLSVNLTRVDVDYEAVLDLSLKLGISTYDASYLYLAHSMGVPLVTFDEQLQRAFLQLRSTP